MLAGVGMAVWSVSRHTYITDFIRIEARGRALAIFGGIGRFGSLTGPVVGGLIGHRFGLNVPIICEAAVAAIVFALIATCIKDPVGTTPQILEKIDHTRKIVTLVRNHARSLYTAGAAYICVQAIREGRRLITPLYGAVIIGLDVVSIGLIITIGSIVDLALFPIAGHIMDRYGRKYAMIPAFVIMAIGFVLMSFADSFEGLLLSQLVIGIGNGFGSGTMMTLGSDLAPTGERGQFLGIWRFIGDVGAVNGVLVVGVLADILSLTVVPIALSGLGVLASTIVFLFVKETLVPQQKPP
jgi:MFS family permease